MKALKITLLPAFFVFSCQVHGETVYADSLLVDDCFGNYSIANRNCDGDDGRAYKTIQETINNSATGDVIYMRGGTYKEISIDIPESLNGTAWTSGNFTTLMSYPGEWAKIDATDLTSTGGLNSGVIVHAEGFDVGRDSQYNEYWKFSNFEVTGGGAGIALKCRNVKMTYLYIHDNGREGVSSLQSGIISVNPQYLEIKYSWFKDNINSAEPNRNNSHILLDGDYKDDSSNSGEGSAWVENASTHHNEIAYNYFELTGDNFDAEHIGFRHKNQQRFGLNSRDPLDMTSKDYGDNFHHNYVTGSRESISTGQDFVQVHNNITDSVINIGRSGDIPITYNHVVYNNTVKMSPIISDSIGATAYISFSGTGGSSTLSVNNFYDNLPQRTVHEHAWFYNNISDETASGFNDVPFRFHRDMPTKSTNPDTDNADLVVENNFIHNNANVTDISIGNVDSGDLCAKSSMKIDDFNTCSEGWRVVGSVINYANTSAGLYAGNAGPHQFLTNYDFEVSSGVRICDGGKAAAHPYLAGVSIPAYIGAANPDDNAWVGGVMFNVRSVDWLMAQVADAPGWIEKDASVTNECKAPPKAPTLEVL